MSKKKNKQPVALGRLSSLYKNFLNRMYVWSLLLIALPVFFIAIILFWLFSTPDKQETKDMTSRIPNILTQQPKIPDNTPTPTVPAPVLKDQHASVSAFTARAIIAVDVESNTVLFSKDEKLQLWPASTTKLMTAVIALDQYSPDDVVTVTNPIQDGSKMGLIEGEKITVENLLYGLLVQSANDAAYALSRFYPKGQDEFVGLMNQKANELGLENTHFYDPAGFDNDKQFTTASDLSKLALYAMKNRTIAHIVSIPLITVPDSEYIHFHQLRNVNKLLGTVPGVAGVKTGWTENAKENLINLTKRNNHEILTVVLGSDDRFSETKILTDWVFDNFTWSEKSSN